MSDNKPRTGTTRISNETIEDARREADRQLAQARAEEEQAALDAGERERIAEQSGALADEADRLRLAVARRTPAEERAEAMARAPGHLLLLLLVFLICYLVAAATNRAGIISFPNSRTVTTEGALTPALDSAASAARTRSVDTGSGAQQAPTYQVAPIFANFYSQQNGSQIFGRPISNLMVVNGREVQWFERARVEHWPENAGTKYEYMLGRLGAEYTQNIQFPNQQFFPSTPQMVYSPMTNHATSQRFLQFWQQNGGLDIFGHPISDEIQEYLTDTGKVQTVQYFERARFEYHPEFAGTPNEIMLGLLGRALYLNDRAPNVISAAKPTPVPMPVPAQ